jgi:hypothetical protein
MNQIHCCEIEFRKIKNLISKISKANEPVKTLEAEFYPAFNKSEKVVAGLHGEHCKV